MKSLNWLLWLILAAAFVGGLAAMDKPVGITFAQWDIEISFGFLFFALFLFIVFFVMIDRAIQNLDWFERMHKRRQMRKARAVMLRGFGHLAARDVAGAQQAAEQVNTLWTGDQYDPFRLVFEGRLAEEEGAFEKADAHYERLAKNKDTKLYALRAQLRLAHSRNDKALVQKISQQALKLAPEDVSIYGICMDAMVAEGEWNKAHKLLHKMAKQDLLSPDVLRQRQAQLYLDEAETAMMRSDPNKARALAAKAAKADNSPQGSAMEIEALIAGGQRRAAIKQLQKAWQKNPHRLLLPLWERLAPKEDAFTFYENMLSANPQSPLTHAALVKAALNGNMMMEARAHLDVLKRHHDDSLEYAETMALAAERIDHNKNEARLWESKAAMLRQNKRGAVASPRVLTADLKDPL